MTRVLSRDPELVRGFPQVAMPGWATLGLGVPGSSGVLFCGTGHDV